MAARPFLLSRATSIAARSLSRPTKCSGTLIGILEMALEGPSAFCPGKRDGVFGLCIRHGQARKAQRTLWSSGRRQKCSQRITRPCFVAIEEIAAPDRIEKGREFAIFDSHR